MTAVAAQLQSLDHEQLLLEDGDASSCEPFHIYLKHRFCNEWQLIRPRLFPEWFFLVVWIAYVTMYVLRTLGFVRHRQLVDYLPEEWCEAIAASPKKPPDWELGDSCVDHVQDLLNKGALLDVLQEILANETPTGFMKTLPEAIEGLTVVVVAFVFIYGCILRRPGLSGRRPYLGNVMTRALRNLAFVFGVRPLFFLFTSLPGPNPKCMGPEEEAIRPRNAWEIFYNFGLSGANCGDLMYSGHMSSLMVLVCSFFYYGRNLLEPQTHVYHVGRVILVLVCISQPLFIAMARNHYTVDLIGAVIIAAMGWRLYDHEFGPDLLPVEFLPEYQEAQRRAVTGDNDAVKAVAELRQLDDREFAEKISLRGVVTGGVVCLLVIVGFFGMVVNTLLGLLTG